MIDFKQIFSTMRSVVISRIGASLTQINGQPAVIRAMTTGTKPKGTIATVDIMDVDDSTAYLTDKIYDPDINGYRYKTVKDITVRLSVRNGNPEDDAAQMDVYTLCNSLHKAFTEELVLGYIHDSINASVASVGRSRRSVDTYITGNSTVQLFDVVLRMVDETTESQVPIETIEFTGDYFNENGNQV